MNIATLQTFQASMEASVRELTARQLALVQSFAEKQKEAFTNPTAFSSSQGFTQSQGLVQEFVAANQAFIGASLLATQTYWREVLADNHANLKAAGLSNVSDMVTRVQDAVEKVVVPAKKPRSKN